MATLLMQHIVGVRGFPERFISSLGTLEDGAGQVWGVLPPAPYKGRKSQEISNWMGPHMGNKVSVKYIQEGLKMRKGVPLTNREKRGRNPHENAFLQKNEVGEDHLKLLFPLGRSSRGLTL